VNDSPFNRNLLVAFLLSIVVLVAWSYLVKTPAPPAEQEKPAPAEQATPAPAPAKPPAPAAVRAAPAVAPRAAAGEEQIVVESDLYRVEFSNRGATVRSWQLRKYRDDAKPPRTLDLVHPPENPTTGEWPLALLLADAQQQTKINSALFEVSPGGRTFHAPVTLDFEWSDGHLAVSKRVKFARDYVVEVSTSVSLDGQPLANAVAWRGGFGDITAQGAEKNVEVFYNANDKLETLQAKKLGVADHPEQPRERAGPVAYGGIEDHYFAAAFLPQGSALTLWDWRSEVAKQEVAEVALGSTTPGPLAMRLYVGPKELHALGQIHPSLTALVQYGWFGFIAKPLFFALEYIHNYVPNYGWAIVVLTLVINMALFPLKMTSWRSMLKMQQVMPEVRNIQNRYKKYSMRDPRKQKMNEEVMAIYRREGVNPMGGCLPMVIQMPIWIALFDMLRVAIELRHAPWIGWVSDLSARDPYYILPALMVVTMYLMQKMTPVATADPTQQKLTQWMPVIFGLMFFYLSSGLILYIFTSNLVGIAQQFYLNRTMQPALAAAAARRGERAK
jgi:YidC/Oxa1 family membrane protein insertase